MEIALVFGTFSMIGVIILFCEKVHRYISYVRKEMKWERVFGANRLLWLLHHHEPESELMMLCHRVLNTTCLARCTDEQLHSLHDALGCIPLHDATVLRTSTSGPTSQILDDNTNRFNLVFICQLVCGKNDLWFSRALDLSSPLIAWSVIKTLLDLQRAPRRSGKSVNLYKSTVEYLLQLFISSSLIMTQDAKETQQKLVFAAMLLNSIFEEDAVVDLPSEVVISWRTMETIIFPLLRTCTYKQGFLDFKGSRVIELINMRHDVSTTFMVLSPNATNMNEAVLKPLL